MAVKPRKQREEKPQISDALRRFFEAGERPETGAEKAELFALAGTPEKAKKLWREFEEDVLVTWRKEQPCTRPLSWWQHSAPRWTRKFDAYFDGTLPEPRQRIGGVGEPAFEHLALVPFFEHGIPKSWVRLDEKDLPSFEAEASYLCRHNLLTPAERRWLDKHPEALEPEVIDPECVYDYSSVLDS